MSIERGKWTEGAMQTCPMKLLVNDHKVFDGLRQEGVTDVLFDLESTLVRAEAADHLMYKRVLLGNSTDEDAMSIRAITERAMNGEMSVEESIRARWGIIRPTLEEMRACATDLMSLHTPHAALTIQALIALGKRVTVVTGGFDCFAEPIADQLGAHGCISNKMNFDGNGDYLGITSDSRVLNGKSKICQELSDTDSRLVLIGDGANDLDAASVVPVVGFGGVASRSDLRSKFPVYLDKCHDQGSDNSSYGSIAHVLSVICTEEEQMSVSSMFPQLAQYVSYPSLT
jgi:HAD superfamily phosphoserine phosphatase-like hydrolase